MENSDSNDLLIKRKSQLWKHPWRYAEGFFIAFGLVVIGFILELVLPQRTSFGMQYPTNFLVLLVFANLLILIHTYFRQKPVVRWMSTVPAAISSITIVVFLVMIMGFIKQGETTGHSFLNALGLNNIKNSYPFLLSQLYFFTTLGLVTIRRSTPLNKKNLGFLLNHFGLWLTLAAASMGSGDLKRLHMNLEEKQDFTNVAYSGDNTTYQLRLALKLIDFDIEEYHPKLGLVETKTEMYVLKDKKNFPEINKGESAVIKDWKFTVKEFYDYAMRDSVGYFPSKNMGASPAALIEAVNIVNNKTVKGWISCGSFILPMQPLSLDDQYTLLMTVPEAKKFTSLVEYITEEGDQDTVLLEVNKPFKLKGWKIYQTSYDEEMGRWSTTSTVELIRDPWLPVVYVGISLLLAGAFYIFWIGRSGKETKN